MLQTGPDNGTAAIAAARAAAAEGDRALVAGNAHAARCAYEDALGALPNHPELLVKLGDACLRLGLAVPAERAFSAVLKTGGAGVHPAVFMRAFHGLLQANVLGGQHERNAEMLTRNMDAFQPERSFLDVLAQALVFTGNERDLAAHADLFLACEQPPVHLPELAVARIREGEVDAGFDVLRRAVQVSPGDPGTIAQFVRGMVAAGRAKDAGAGLACLERNGVLDGRSVFAQYQLGRYCDITDRLEALDRDPDYPLHRDYDRPLPVATGLSRMVCGRADARDDADRWGAPVVDAAALAEAIAGLRAMVRTLKAAGTFDIQLDNIAAARARFAPEAGDPVQILSTGRCGTRALYFLLRRMESVLPYHSAQFATIAVERNHLLYRLLTGRLDRDAVAAIALTYLQTRTAELIHAYSRGRTPVVVTHWDTVFGAVNAELFPGMRFLYMHRAPGKVFRSMFGKNQWQNIQLMHMLYDRTFPDGAFLARFQQDLQPEERIAWYLHVTQVLARGLLAGLAPGQGRELESEAMFAASDEAFATLADLIPGWSIDRAAFAAHFGEQRNTKDELLQVDEDELDQRAARVPGLMAQLVRDGRF